MDENTLGLIQSQAPLSAAPKPPSANASRAEIRAVADEMESFFLGQALEVMFADIKTDGPFGGGNGEKMFRSFLIQEYGKMMSSQGGIGLADEIERELLQQQEITP